MGVESGKVMWAMPASLAKQARNRWPASNTPRADAVRQGRVPTARVSVPSGVSLPRGGLIPRRERRAALCRDASRFDVGVPVSVMFASPAVVHITVSHRGIGAPHPYRADVDVAEKNQEHQYRRNV